MTREEAVNRLCDIYSGEFDVRLCEEHRKPLAAQMDFYAESSKYVLSKKAKLWEANSFEYVYLFNVPHLTKEIYDQCEKLAYDEGMARIKPGPNHMYTYITALFVCDSCDEDAQPGRIRLALNMQRTVLFRIGKFLLQSINFFFQFVSFSYVLI